MITASYQFENSKVKFYFEQSIKGVDSFSKREFTVFITDENIFNAYPDFFENRKVVLIQPGENSKSFATVNHILEKFIHMKVNKDYLIVGMGGGVITDITGYVASIYMRGLRFAFLPTSLLAMVDAAIGGKNGINFGNYKNIIGTIQQPEWIIFDRTMLYTLPHEEWINAFAEIIKYGVILDENLFRLLQQYQIEDFQNKHYLTAKLLYICTHLKALLVEKDVTDKAERRLLNFGHTAGHAIEKLENLPHGHAIAKGMLIALSISVEINNFSSAEKEEVITLLEKYHLPVSKPEQKEAVLEWIIMDKKRESDGVHFILADKIGKGKIVPIPMVQLKDMFEQML